MIDGINILFGIILVIILVIVVSGVRSFIIKKRISYASRFGKSEHFFGRLMGLLSFASIIWCYFGFPYLMYLLIATFVSWGIYLISHTLEKKLYPARFRF